MTPALASQGLSLMQHPLAAMFVAFAVGAAGGFSAGVLVVIADFRRKR